MRISDWSSDVCSSDLWKHDVGLRADHLELVNVAERPIVVTPRSQVLYAAWRIVGMSLPTGQRGVEYADVEHMLLSRRIRQNQVLGDRWRRKALTMDRDGEFGKVMGIGPPRSEQPNVRRPRNGARYDGGGVVVAGQQECRDTGLVQAAHCLRKIEAGPHVAPVAVEQIPRSEEHTSELQSLMRISYAVLCLKKKKQI